MSVLPIPVLIADYDWLRTPHGELLHHAKLTDEQHKECEDWGGVYDDPVTLDCGRTATTVLIPGMFSRMSATRCPRCCAATGLPAGVGSPKNDDACREILGMNDD